MDNPILKNSMQLFAQLGKVKSRSMFGGFGIFVDDTMFALAVNSKLHIRTNPTTVATFKQNGFKPYVYKKRGFPVVTKYFALPEDSWDDSEIILSYARSALDYAKDEKVKQSDCKPTRLKDLPNLRLATERMLKKAGIESVNSLQEHGSVEAFKAIQKTHSTSVGLELLWALEGAINGTHWSVIPQAKRDELANHIN
ncbi:DNA transformation protein [Vibrio sp. 10N.286.49.C2]|uniref:TfoX/Sxy family DNA transformation protein n=1 Tax=unclassified Vibrio TaxID=2614977 RepID=UPI000C846F5E|nr:MULTISPECIES: TfoX/Sxy family DNA transformation protein [unclassified Vibrio]PMH37739.1 DNA transformation protein [Vibrio sp. 10N.286.49.C2]PMH45096.1 DNA transformation protein [Vibrio sp. 10N.286.49.B1]PMH77925.1 DNA transformation protein [Vibrio sp. 10N.286.48.B7]